ncbi:anti-sigma factor family protein [Saccharibacillus alkalitolerans]|uniref:DUF4179 domain-containing protein n=1 Tax=Saccharibacillus alkalitolerans TaxID=2705290 RepID=A0ABX0FAX4_9BACL|nr:hypothetical protein [Saccharibacillus alkalitolerans]NGZ77109.1 hypothetical protein [Saccharibacillus alkalitolerans]
MRCFSRSELERYAMTENAPSAGSSKAGMEAHLKECSVCKKELERIRAEQRMLENAFYAESPDDNFTAGVMKALESVEIERSGSKAAPGARQGRRAGQWKKTRLAAASALLLLAGGGGYALLQGNVGLPGETDNPTSVTAGPKAEADDADRERIGKLLNDPDYEWSWTHKAALLDAFGLVAYPDISLNDKKSGYSFEVKAVLTDASRIVILTRTTDADGQPVSRAFPYEIPFALTDSEGKEAAVHALTDQSPVNGMEAYVYLLNQPAPDRINLRGEIKEIFRIDPEQEREEAVQTDPLTFDYALDLSKAKKYAVSSDIGETYKSPDGLSIEVRRLIRTPEAIRIDLHTSSSGEVRERTPGALGGQMEFQFRIEDQEGSAVGRFGSAGGYSKPDIISNRYDESSGEGEWEIVYPLIEGKGMSEDGREPYRFILEGYRAEMEGRGEITFAPSDLAENPAVMEDEGDRFELTGAEVGERDGMNAVYLDYRSEYVNAREGIWEAVDENGQIYYPEPAADSETRFEILDMKKLPEQLTLRRTMVPKLYGDLGWSFELPHHALSVPEKDGQ